MSSNEYSQQYGPHQYGPQQYDPRQYVPQYGQQQYGQQQYGQQQYGQQYGAQQYGPSQYGSYGPPQPNSQQPSNSYPTPSTGSQPGFNLQLLSSLPYVQIKQKVEDMEVITGYETSNKYAVLDPQGGLLMKCSEKSTTLAKLALGAGRAMDINITDPSDVTVNDPSGKVMGTILKKFAVGKTIFHVMNRQEQQIFTIRGGAFINIGTNRKFSITNSQGTEVGHIQKEWAGFMKEAFTDADHFSVHFPAGCDAETCALLIAATLFIDLSHFEK